MELEQQQWTVGQTEYRLPWKHRRLLVLVLVMHRMEMGNHQTETALVLLLHQRHLMLVLVLLFHQRRLKMALLPRQRHLMLVLLPRQRRWWFGAPLRKE
jgi:hypothetical protein